MHDPSSQSPSLAFIRKKVFSWSHLVARKFPLNRKLLYKALLEICLNKSLGCDNALALVSKSVTTLIASSDSTDGMVPPIIKTLDSYRCSLSFKDSLSGRPTSWQPLKGVGDVKLRPEDILPSFDHSRPFKAPKGNLKVHKAQPTGPILDLLQDLKNNNCIKEVSPNQAPTLNMSVRNRPDGSKALAIADCRDLINKTAIAPSRLELPDITSLFRHQDKAQDLWMTKLDISSAYWSTKLPANLPDLFRFQVGEKVFALLSLPFGWSHSPYIFQHKLQKLVKTCLESGGCHMVLVKQYLDDIFLYGNGKDAVKHSTALIASSIEEEGWNINRSKSIFEPTKDLTWLGKRVQIIDNKIFISVCVDTITNICILILWISSRPWPQKILHSLTGLMSWATTHSRLALPFLHASHCYIHAANRQVHPPQQVRNQLIKAMAMLTKPVSSIQIAPALEFDPALPLLFVDASAAEGFIGAVLVHNGTVFMSSFLLPKEMCEEKMQQLAELYATKRGIQWARSRDLLKFTLITDNLASLWSLKKMSSGICQGKRSKVLKQIATILFENDLSVLIAFCPSIIHPADVPSRLSKLAPLKLKPPFTDIRAPEPVSHLALYIKNHPELISCDNSMWPSAKSSLIAKLNGMGVSC